MEANRLAKMCFAPERLEGRLVPEPACPRRATAASNPQTELEREPLKVGDLPRNEDDILELEAAEDLAPLKATQLRVDPVEQVGARLEWSVATQVVLDDFDAGEELPQAYKRLGCVLGDYQALPVAQERRLQQRRTDPVGRDRVEVLKPPRDHRRAPDDVRALVELRFELVAGQRHREGAARPYAERVPAIRLDD